MALEPNVCAYCEKPITGVFVGSEIGNVHTECSNFPDHWRSETPNNANTQSGLPAHVMRTRQLNHD
ncbi:hypothetical protein NL529_28120, partial [Klebsiella pneumoniae]|nr:hypothetical protein [Klebsiella pneumoniae]